MSAIFVNLLPLQRVGAPVTNATGGTSQGNPSAGAKSIEFSDYSIVHTKDKAGAGVLTAVVIIGITSMFTWMSTGK